jgi:hypothetical protein
VSAPLAYCVGFVLGALATIAAFVLAEVANARPSYRPRHSK